MSVASHRAAAPTSVPCAIVTISDTRTLETDTSGLAVAELLTAAGHEVRGRVLVKDDSEAVSAAVRAELAGTARVIITTGGTGIASRDNAFEAVAGLLEKRMDGFGELFRMLSFREIGAAAMLSRACAGVAGRTAIFVLPGSEAAVRLAMRQLIIPELGHVVRELSR